MVADGLLTRQRYREVPPRVLHEYDQQAFEPALRAGAATGVMASYNLVNGRPNTVSPQLNDLRSLSKYPLFNVSDAYAPYNLTGSQQYYPTQPAADAAMFKAGIDAYVADNNDPSVMIADVKAALDQGLLTVADIERADRDALSVRFRLGEFDPDGGPYGHLDASAVNTPDRNLYTTFRPSFSSSRRPAVRMTPRWWDMLTIGAPISSAS